MMGTARDNGVIDQPEKDEVEDIPNPETRGSSNSSRNDAGVREGFGPVLATPPCNGKRQA